ncbi:MAG: ABC transporter permease subunit [Thermodesulfobacteriota bacterium]
MLTFFKNPMTRKRLSRFKALRRAYISFWVLIALYGLSLGAELICNSSPLYVRFQGRSYFPVIRFYPEDVFTGSGRQTRPDYHQINKTALFAENPENYMLFPPFPHGPYKSVDPDTIEVSDVVTLRFNPMPQVGTINIAPDFTIKRAVRMEAFTAIPDKGLRGLKLTDFFELPGEIREATAVRFSDHAAPAMASEINGQRGQPVFVSLSTYAPRGRPPKSVRLTFRIPENMGNEALKALNSIRFNRSLERVLVTSEKGPDLWEAIPEERQKEILQLVESRYFGPVDNLRVTLEVRDYMVEFQKQDVRFPFPPVNGHPLGIDRAGRDVMARILYGMRTSMTFGLILVVGSMCLGIAAGAAQGYYGGLIDITGQRFIEIWSALPFLYIMILMGSIYGRSFSLLIFCYGLFNWIGISYYIRAEFFRLRSQPFVEAARCMGVGPLKIIFKHILPNGMIPVITFFPFSLVGAIGSLAALDYLGFGLPPPTPSWGELLFQAQQYRWAWWLILYPSVALFLVMLLGVFVGEGVRNAYDPKQFTRLE